MFRYGCLLLVLLIGCNGSLIDSVNMYIGTDGHGYGIGGLPVGAQVPFGMVRLSPDSTLTEQIWVPWWHTGGYYYNDTHIRMFSHTHCSGAGELDYGTIGVMPSSTMPRRIGTGYIDRYPFMQRFSHDNETAQPGYYSVRLLDEDINVELSATTNMGAHRITYSPSSSGRWMVFDVSYTLKYMGCAESEISIDVTSQTISGNLLNMGDMSSRFGGMRVYFYATFNETFNQYGVWDDNGKFHDNNGYANGTTVGGYVGFPSSVNSVEMLVGISFISTEQAAQNLQTQSDVSCQSDSLFDCIRQQTQNQWEDMLNTVQINSVGSIAEKDNITAFYTAVYHTYVSPTTFSESGGVYLGFDNQVHSLTENSNYPMNAYYTDLSIWDTFRSQFPWLSISRPTEMGDIAQSLVAMFEQGGDLPRWPMANGYTNTMIGTHADIVLADTMAHGIEFDYQTAYQGMYQGATETQVNAGRSDIQDWLTIGFIPYDDDGDSCCNTLAYAYDDWCVGLMAKKLGIMDDYYTFNNRSFNFQNVWENNIQFMCPKYINGTYDCPEHLLYPGDSRYVEGDAWHYRFYAPQQPEYLTNLFNSSNYYLEQLETFFSESFSDKLAPFNMLPNPYYWGGNEHDLFSVYQFAYAGRIDRTQYWVRNLLSRHYPNRPNGLSGNDDYGALSSWGLLNFLGIYPRAGDGSFIASIPFFEKVTITRDQGNITLIANNLSADNIYVSGISINGEQQSSPFISASQLSGNSIIEFYLTNTPSPY